MAETEFFGIVQPDLRAFRAYTARYSGTVGRPSENSQAPGLYKRLASILTISSPQLDDAQVQLLRDQNSRARQQLLRLGVMPSQIKYILKRGEPAQFMAAKLFRDAFVSSQLSAGQTFHLGQQLFSYAYPNGEPKVVIYAPADMASRVEIGQPATVSAQFPSGQSCSAVFETSAGNLQTMLWPLQFVLPEKSDELFPYGSIVTVRTELKDGNSADLSLEWLARNWNIAPAVGETPTAMPMSSGILPEAIQSTAHKAPDQHVELVKPTPRRARAPGQVVSSRFKPGDRVGRGQVVLTVKSEALVHAQTAFLDACFFCPNEELACRLNLQQLGFAASQIEALRHHLELLFDVPILAPANGTVTDILPGLAPFGSGDVLFSLRRGL